MGILTDAMAKGHEAAAAEQAQIVARETQEQENRAQDRRVKQAFLEYVEPLSIIENLVTEKISDRFSCDVQKIPDGWRASYFMNLKTPQPDLTKPYHHYTFEISYNNPHIDHPLEMKHVNRFDNCSAHHIATKYFKNLEDMAAHMLEALTRHGAQDHEIIAAVEGLEKILEERENIPPALPSNASEGSPAPDSLS